MSVATEMLPSPRSTATTTNITSGAAASVTPAPPPAAAHSVISHKKKKKALVVYKAQMFPFPNGDTYFGEFSADLESQQIFRHGEGTYTTADGYEVYGNWHEDKLILTNVKIQFPNKQTYDGVLSNNYEYTIGTYKFPDGGQFDGDFDRNFQGRRTDGVSYTDPNGKPWLHKPTDLTDPSVVVHHKASSAEALYLTFDWQHEYAQCATELTCSSSKSVQSHQASETSET